MVKTINIHVSYNNQKELIICEWQEIPNKIASRFGINMKDFIMYDKDENEISLNDIGDLMQIKIVPRRNGQQTLHSYMDVDSEPKRILDNIISKLRHNTTLNGQERKLLVEALETHSTAIFKKRKLSEGNIKESKPKQIHRKVQVRIFSQNIKESFAQTDPFKGAESHVNNVEDSISALKRLWSFENKPFEEIETLMKETFNERRSFILIKCPPISMIKELYPALFCVEQVKSELDRIFYPGKYLEFLSNMQKYYKYILHYGDGDDINEKTKRAIAVARTPVQKTYAGVVGSIFILTKLLGENFGFIHLSDYPHGTGELYPHIDASYQSLKKIFFDGTLFRIIVEGKLLCEASDFPEAILCLMASFFIFNIHYPESCCRTLTVFEKLFLKANDTADMDDLTVQIVKTFELSINGDQVKNGLLKS